MKKQEAIEKMKEKKATGKDRIPNEAFEEHLTLLKKLS